MKVPALPLARVQDDGAAARRTRVPSTAPGVLGRDELAARASGDGDPERRALEHFALRIAAPRVRSRAPYRQSVGSTVKSIRCAPRTLTA